MWKRLFKALWGEYPTRHGVKAPCRVVGQPPRSATARILGWGGGRWVVWVPWVVWALAAGELWGASVTLAWDRSPDAVAGYRLFWGTNARTGTSGSAYFGVMDVGNVTTAKVGGLSNGVDYFFAVTAYRWNGTNVVESALSSEISFRVTNTVVPPPGLVIAPPWVVLTLEGGLSVTGRWDVVGSTQGFYRGKVLQE